MSDKQNETRQQAPPFDTAAIKGMMEKMMARLGKGRDCGCGCAGMTSGEPTEQEMPAACGGMMAQMAESCCAASETAEAAEDV